MKKLLTTTAFFLMVLAIVSCGQDAPDFEETRQAAERGDGQAQFYLGYMYLQGVGVAANAQEGIEWYHRAAEQGILGAIENLGLMYKYGIDTSENHAEAIKWLRIGAKRGLANIQANLAQMYEEGKGVKEDLIQAYVWFSAAASQNYNESREDRDRVARKLSSSQLAIAENRADQCFQASGLDCESGQTKNNLEDFIKYTINNFDAQEFRQSLDASQLTAKFSIIPIDVTATANGLGLIWTRKLNNSFDDSEIEALKTLTEIPLEFMEDGYCTEIPMEWMKEFGYSIREILTVNDGEVIRNFLVDFESCTEFLTIIDSN